MSLEDVKIMVLGALGWAAAVPVVKMAGSSSAKSSTNKLIGYGVGAGISLITTPLLSSLLGWESPHERVRGVALALGTAQVIDGIVHLFYPKFYNRDRDAAILSAGHIFSGAGLLGILSAYM